MSERNQRCDGLISRLQRLVRRRWRRPSHGVERTGALIREYAHYPGVDQPHSVRDASGNVYYYSMEYPGHVSGLFNAANQVVNQYSYNPWGEMEAVTENVQQPFRYMGRELDPITGLYYVRNRWYDPVAARFVSEDPIGLAGGINLYAYVENRPTLARDPTGLRGGTDCIDWYLLLINEKTGVIVLEAYVHTTCSEGSAGSQDLDSNRQCPLPPELPPGANVDKNIKTAEFARWRDLGGFARDWTYLWFYDKVKKHGEWDYQQSVPGLNPQWEAGGNFNYGATGTALRIPSWILLRAAGWAQSRNPGGVKPGNGHPLGRAPHGDERFDQTWIKQGIRYYRNRCYDS